MQIISATDQIVDFIRNAIFSGKYQPGERLKETEIAKWLSVSRTPIRQALHKLEAEGLVNYKPNKGAMIPNITEQDIDEICELRILIESYSIRKYLRLVSSENIEEMSEIIKQMESALSKKDIPNYFAHSLDFHAYYIRYCQNERIYACFTNIRNTMRIAQSFLGQNGSFYHQSLKEHIEIMALIKARSSECETVLKLHIEDASARMKTQIRLLPNQGRDYG